MDRLVKILIVLLIAVGLYYYIPTLSFGDKTVDDVPSPSFSKVFGRETVEVNGVKVDIKEDYKCEVSGIVTFIEKYTDSDAANKACPVDMIIAYGNAAKYNNKIDYECMLTRREAIISTGFSSVPAGLSENDKALDQHLFCRLIPSNDDVRTQMLDLDENDYVKIVGMAGDVTFYNESGSASSKFTTDTSRGTAVIYVTSITELD